MAYASLTCVIQSLEQFLKYSPFMIPTRKTKIESLHKSFRSLQDFVEKYGNVFHTCDKENKLRDAAYKAEDIVDSKIRKVHLAKNLKGQKHSYIVMCKRLQQVIGEMECIQEEIAIEIGKSNIGGDDKGCSLNVVSSRQIPNQEHQQDQAIITVGLDNDFLRIADRLTGQPSTLDVITIVGMGGIGKTTLARRLFEDSLVVYHFHSRAWITASQEHQVREMLVDLLCALDGSNNEIYKESNEQITERLYKSLKGRTYLIVIDDVWSTQAWDGVKRAFPNDNNGSRIMLTSRLTDISTHANPYNPPHQVNLLDKDESWELLFKKLFDKEHCPPELENIGKNIVARCQGLPLAIVVVAGHLSKIDRTQKNWESFAQSASSIVSGNPRQCMDILALSYNHLPQHLKACFLYVGSFPEDFAISIRQLIRLWMAEGFLQPTELKSMEMVAEEYLVDLVDRNLILVAKKSSNGKIRTCQIHDVLREFCLKEAQQENFLCVLKKKSDFLGRMINQRRIIFNSRTYFLSRFINSTPVPTSPLRSILCFTSVDVSLRHLLDFRLLRVLDISTRYTQHVAAIVEQLLNLRYLAISIDQELPSSFLLNLGYLQTLVLWISSKAPVFSCDIWKLLYLRHVYVNRAICLTPPRKANEEKVNERCNFSLVLENLLTISKLSLNSCTKQVFSKIPNLKKLGIFEAVESYPIFSDSIYSSENLWPHNIQEITDQWSHCLQNLGLLYQLETLKLTFLKIVSKKPRLLPHLNVHAFPQKLKKLTLSFSYLPWECMDILGQLPNLKVLKLKNYAFTGPNWEAEEEGFPRLRYLLIEFTDLVNWNATGGPFRCLEYLKLRHCYCLNEIPSCIGELPSLQIIDMDDSSPPALISAKQIHQEQRSWGNDSLQLRISFIIKQNPWTSLEFFTTNDAQLEVNMVCNWFLSDMMTTKSKSRPRVGVCIVLLLAALLLIQWLTQYIKVLIMADEVPQPLNYIPEVILKKRRNNEEWAIRRKLQLEQRVKKPKSDSFVIKKPEQFIREYRDKEMDLVQMKQRGKSKTKHGLITPDSKLLFVIRIGGKSDMHPTTRKLLYSLRLRRVFSGAFVKADGRIMEILRKVEPYVTYGYPNLKSVKDLIYKKGAGRVDNQRVPLTNNETVEQALGQYGIICLEDVVNEIANVGSHFKEVASFLYPFALTKPEKALQGKKRRYKDGGDSGNREDHINELISKMN